MFCHCTKWSLPLTFNRKWKIINLRLLMMKMKTMMKFNDEVRNLVPEMIKWTLKLSLRNTAQHRVMVNDVFPRIYGVLEAPVTIRNIYIPSHRNGMNVFGTHNNQSTNNPHYSCQENSSDSALAKSWPLVLTSKKLRYFPNYCGILKTFWWKSTVVCIHKSILAYYTWRLYRRGLHASSGQGEASMDPFAKQIIIVDYAKIGLSTVKE